MEKSTGRKPKELENPTEFPKPLSHVWSFFLELHSARTAGFSGPNPITFSEMEAWSKLTHQPINPFDVAVIKQIDNTYLRATSNG